MPNVNPHLLVWARETAGLSREKAVKKLQLGDAHGIAAVDRLAALEFGEDHPTRSMLVKMAKQYRRPLVTFYLEELPRKSSHGADFRTLSGDGLAVQDTLVQALLREIVAKQDLVRVQLEEDDAEEIDFIGSKSLESGQHAVLTTLEAVVKGINQKSEFNALRDAVERLGVFVLLQGDLGSHHTDIDTDVFRGFALADRLAPFIVINDNDARTAWSFTLLHEVVHLILGKTGISNNQTETKVEQFCNDIASEYLLPQSEIESFLPHESDFDQLTESIDTLASEWKVSRALIAYRLYRSQHINSLLYHQLADTFHQQWIEHRRNSSNEGGPDYYKVRRHRTGKALLNFVRHALGEGALSTMKAAVVLGVKPTQVGPMLEMQTKT